MTFNILDWRDRLEIVKETQSQITAKCPVCEGTNLKIDPKSGKWQCWDYPDDPAHKKAIRDAINPPTKPGDRAEKPQRKAARTEWVYECADPKHRVKATRIDHEGKGKQFFQSYKIKNRWVKGRDVDDTTKDHIRSMVLPLYHAEILKKLPQADYLFICEGEKSVDRMRSLGLLATTVLSAKWKGVRDYFEVFRGLEDKLVIVPDRDKPGAGFAMAIYATFPKSRWLHPYPESPLWNARLPHNGGVDIADWIDDGATAEEIVEAITDLPKVAIANWDQDPPTEPEPTPATDGINLLAEVQRIIDRELDEGEMMAALIELGDRTGKPLSVLQRLYKSCLAQRERDEALNEGATGLGTLLRFAQKEIPLEQILPPHLATALHSKANSDRLDPVRLMANLLAASATMLGGRVSIVAKQGKNKHDDWKERAIVWCCDCSPPSTGKSVAQRAIYAPIKRRQREADAKHESDLKILKELQEDWRLMSSDDKAQYRGTGQDPARFEDQMVEEVKLLEVGQIEAVLKLLAKLAPNSGVCWLRDELAGLFRSLDQYSSAGKGEGQQILLTAWNGPMDTSVRRVDDKNSFRLKGQLLNLCGGIQPDVARKLFSLQDDPDGLLSRVLPCVPKIPDDFAVWSDTTVDLYPCLDKIYSKLEAIPSHEFRFTPDAKKLWQKRWETLKRGLVKNLENKPSFAYFLGKQTTYVPRFALILHCIEVACEVRPLTEEIEVDTLRRAIALSDYFCGQFLLLLSNAAGESGALSPDLLKICKLAQKKGGTISRREAQQNLSNKKKRWRASEIGKLFDAIASQGIAKIDGKNLVLLKKVQHFQQTAETQTGQGIEVLEKGPTRDQQVPTNVGRVGPMLDPDPTPQTQSQGGLQPFVGNVGHSPEDRGVNRGSEWAIRGRSVIITSTTPDRIFGVMDGGDGKIFGYDAPVDKFIQAVDGPSPAPQWLKNVASAPERLEVGDRVEYTGEFFPALRFAPQPWTVKQLHKDQVYCEDGNGDMVPKRSLCDLRKAESAEGDQTDGGKAS